MKQKMKVALLGGTKGMGRALARAMAKEGHDICLLGRHEEDLRKSVADLAAFAGGDGTGSGRAIRIYHAPCDLSEPDGFAAALDAADAQLGQFDCFVVTAGEFGMQAELEQDLARTERLLRLNFVNTVLLCEHVRQRLLARGGGRLCVFSSVAGDRGRKPIGLYGSSKAGLSHYLESLDHRHRNEGLVTLCVKPGFVKTGMTAGLKPPPFAGDPDVVADQVLVALQADRPLVYAPAIWRWVMLVIRHLPRWVMRKIQF
jgi:decaprenylphospho-beta-D-erythro-pentofuranosid-2-ulose 2-reductase